MVDFQLDLVSYYEEKVTKSYPPFSFFSLPKSSTGEREPSMFDHLCDNASSCVATHSHALAEVSRQ